MSDTAYASLQQDLARADKQIADLRPDANAHAVEGLAHGEHFLAMRQQHALRSILDRAVVTPTVDRAVLGSRVRYREGDASAAAISLVISVDAEPAVGRISVTSPMGAAILGRREGDIVRVRTPGGVRVLTIIGVD
jgi:transcription elongation GreA/GreB family factor